MVCTWWFHPLLASVVMLSVYFCLYNWVWDTTQGVVIPIVAVVTAATGVKGSRGQGQFSNLVTVVKMFMFCACILHIV